MATIPLEALQRESEPGVPLFALGFRPFFLAAGIAAMALVGLWVIDYAAWVSPRTYFGELNWHAHEMVFGYATAVVAGFLLTSVRNWTNLQTAQGPALAALLALWVAGRAAPFLPQWLPAPLIAAIDAAFVPALALTLAVPLLRRRQIRNLPFLPILAVLFAANAMVHLQVLGLAEGTAQRGLYLGVDVILLLITVIGGRVIPFFTERALPGAKPRVWRPIEALAPASVLVLAALGLLQVAPLLTVAAGIVAATVHAIRLWGWADRRLWSVPLLWILFLGYGWMVAGFLLEALAAAGLVMPTAALHAYTAGGIGSLTLGMMARVALGHTGRPLRPAAAVVIAFALVSGAAFVRVVAPLALPDELYVGAITAAGLLWMIAFALFLAVYAPILLRPRADGLRG